MAPMTEAMMPGPLLPELVPPERPPDEARDQ